MAFRLSSRKLMYGIIGTGCTSMCVYIRVKLPEVIGTDLPGGLGNDIVRMLFGKTRLISISDLTLEEDGASQEIIKIKTVVLKVKL